MGGILILVKNPIEFLCFSSLSIINTEKVSLLLMCSVKKGFLEIKLQEKLINAIAANMD